jgi:hypothetical protein
VPDLRDRPIFTPGLPGEPGPPWPSAPRGCPRCGSEETSLDPVRPRFLLLWFLKATTCNACGLQFGAASRRSLTPVIVAAYTAPLVLAVLLVSVFFFLR